MLKALLCDLDGTLVDTREANLTAYRKTFSEFQIVYDDFELQSHIGLVPWQTLLKACCPDLGEDLAQKLVLYKRGIYHKYFNLVNVNLGLIDLIKSVRPEMKTAVVTSASKRSAYDILKAKSLEVHFDKIITSDDCTRHKPHPQPYQMAAAAFGIDSEHCVVFEDSEPGIRSAELFGANVIKVSM